MRRTNPTLAIAIGAVVACTDATLAPAPPPSDAPPVDEGVPDASGTTLDANSADAVATHAGCPPPAKITPADVPAGYLAPVKVTIAFLADGDSGRFHFPNAPDQGVRMLFVNTEESGGPEMTAFGVTTKGIVHKWINDAANIQMAVREDFKGSKTPDIDPFGRWLSMMFLDGELLQTRIVREGLSAYYTQFGCALAPFHEPLLHAEAEANANARGIWGPGPHNDYKVVLDRWIGNRTCRPNPFVAPYCP